MLDLQKRWQTDALDMPLYLLSALIGVNDRGKAVPFDKLQTDE